MINLDGIFSALVEYWGSAAFPNWSANQFINEVDSRGIATPAETTLYLQHFVEQANAMAVMDGTTWVDLTSRVQEVGLSRATTGGRNVHDQVLQLAEFEIAKLQDRLDTTRAALAVEDLHLSHADTIRAWLADNAPGSAEVKAAALEFHDRGATDAAVRKSRYEALIAELEDKIRQLGGEPT